MIDPITQHHVTLLHSRGITGEPCDEWQVQDIEHELRVKLPPAYKAFLLLAGQGFRPFEGSHYALEHDLAELQRFGRRVLLKDKIELPTGSFVFFAHQGFAIRFFFLNDGDDPAVFEYVQGEPPVTQIAPSFLDFLTHEFHPQPIDTHGPEESPLEPKT